MGSVCSGSGHAALCLLITTSISGGCPPPPIGYGCLGRPLLLLMLPGSVDRVRHLATVCVLSHARLYLMLRFWREDSVTYALCHPGRRLDKIRMKLNGVWGLVITVFPSYPQQVNAELALLFLLLISQCGSKLCLAGSTVRLLSLCCRGFWGQKHSNDYPGSNEAVVIVMHGGGLKKIKKSLQKETGLYCWLVISHHRASLSINSELCYTSLNAPSITMLQKAIMTVVSPKVF